MLDTIAIEPVFYLLLGCVFIMKTYKIALFGELMDVEWNPMEKSLYEHIKPHLRFKRDWDELEGIFEPKTGYVHVSLRGGVGA